MICSPSWRYLQNAQTDVNTMYTNKNSGHFTVEDSCVTVRSPFFTVKSPHLTVKKGSTQTRTRKFKHNNNNIPYFRTKTSSIRAQTQGSCFQIENWQWTQAQTREALLDHENAHTVGSDAETKANESTTIESARVLILRHRSTTRIMA